jgi:3-deoxy-7-phosphoheptulonate synthase
MLIVMEKDATATDIQTVVDVIESKSCVARPIPGGDRVSIGILHNKGSLDPSSFLGLAGVKDAIPVSRPYKLVSREFQKEDTLITVGDVTIGNGHFVIIAGPCAVESEKQALTIAEHVRRAGAVTEVMDEESFDLVEAYADIIQIGTRNMQNFSLLRRSGRSHKPIFLKRGLAATVEEWLMAAEYILEKGNSQVILCERGVRTFVHHSRNTLDLSAVPVVHKESHLPIIIDPSHAAGRRDQVIPLSRAAAAVGAHGLMVEVHHRPEEALSDGAQSLYPDQFADLCRQANTIFATVNQNVSL